MTAPVCHCYVRDLTDEVRFGLRYGAFENSGGRDKMTTDEALPDAGQLAAIIQQLYPPAGLEAPSFDDLRDSNPGVYKPALKKATVGRSRSIEVGDAA